MSKRLPEFHSGDLQVRFLQPDEASKMLIFRRENRGFLEPWEPRRRPEFFSEPYWQLQTKAAIREFQGGHSLCLVLLDASGSEVFGVCNFTNIIRGTFQSCHLGYALGERHQGKGFMHQALSLSLDYVFSDMDLHRVMANYLPHNRRSGKLLAQLGFEEEGHARKFLLINGRWEDHILTSLLREDWLGTPGQDS